MTDNRSNAFVEAMNGLLQRAKRAARGFRTASNFIAIAYLRMSKLTTEPNATSHLAARLGQKSLSSMGSGRPAMRSSMARRKWATLSRQVCARRATRFTTLARRWKA
jgi:hypothetical protein